METVAIMAKAKDSKAFTYKQDFDNYNGMFVYKNAKTLDRYQELKPLKGAQAPTPLGKHRYFLH